MTDSVEDLSMKQQLDKLNISEGEPKDDPDVSKQMLQESEVVVHPNEPITEDDDEIIIDNSSNKRKKEPIFFNNKKPFPKIK